jgi:uncharacterized protein (UPF0332 family)
MEGSVIDLSGYRYAVFHALRAITALDHFDSGKHSGIIVRFFPRSNVLVPG